MAKTKKEINLKYYRSINGVITTIYLSQKQRSKKKKYSAPNYTKEELKEWLYDKTDFLNRYNLWVNSNYDKWNKPSCDRLNDYLPYSLKNLQLITWKENDDKGKLDRKKGLNNKTGKPIIGINIVTLKVIKFHSAHEAARKLNISRGTISSCCIGYKSCNTYKDYIFKYL